LDFAALGLPDVAIEDAGDYQAIGAGAVDGWRRMWDRSQLGLASRRRLPNLSSLGVRRDGRLAAVAGGG